MNTEKLFSQGTKVLAFVTLAASSAIFLGSSSRVLRHWLGSTADPITTFSPILVFLLTLAGVLLYLWSEVLTSQSPLPGELRFAPPTRKRARRMILIFQILLSVILFSRTLAQINVPLDWDEHEHVSELAGGDAWLSINPFRGSENHSVAAASSYLSMKILGPTKFAARLPALLFAMAFLCVLNVLCFYYVSPTTSLFCFLALAGNITIIYMMHSMRGYIPMLLFTTVALCFVLDFINGKEFGVWHLLGFALATGLAIFCHPFGGLFTALLCMSLIVWLYVRRKALSAPFKKTGNILLVIQGLWLCAFALVSIFVLAHLRDTGFALPKGDIPKWVSDMAPYRLFTLFGLVRMWEIKLFVVLLLCLIGIRLARPSKAPFSFLTLLLLSTVLVIGAVSRLLHLPLLEGRMLTPFLVIFLLWIGDTIDRIAWRPARGALFVATLSLLTLPFHLHHDADDGVPEFLAGHEQFAAQVTKLISTFQDRCLSFSGDPSGVKYASQFYFLRERKVSPSDNCAHHFHLFYGEGLFQTSFEWTPPQNARSVTRLFEDSNGRVLFEIQNGTKRLTMRAGEPSEGHRSTN